MGRIVVEAGTVQVPGGTAARGVGAAAARPLETGHNIVTLLGRVSKVPEQRELPSGDQLVSFRLVVPRPAGSRAAGSGTVDTIDCVVWKPMLQRRVQRWVGGETVEVSGALRRRFWRGPTGASSRTEVEVEGVKVERMRPTPPQGSCEDG